MYASAYVFEPGEVRGVEVVPESLTTIDEVIEWTNDLPGDVCFLGSETIRHHEILRLRTRATCLDKPASSLCRPSDVALLGLAALKEGQSEDAMDFAPSYLRPSAAEVRWAEKRGAQ